LCADDRCRQCENNVHIRAREACNIDYKTLGMLHVNSRGSQHRSARSQSSDAFGGLSTHIGELYYVSVTSGYGSVDIRRVYVPYRLAKENVHPTRNGIGLRLDE